jgi:hypothetical protein
MSLTRNLKESWLNAPVDGEFIEFEATRKDWDLSGVQELPSTIHPANLDTLNRCVALSLELELPVGAFIRALLEREDNVPVGARFGLIENIHDEEKHEQAFRLIASVLEIPLAIKHQAKKFRESLVHSNVHPLEKARDLETIVFVPMQAYIRTNSNQSIERVLVEVSRDEMRHVCYNWEVSAELSIGITDEFNDYLAEEVTDWIYAPLQNDEVKTDYNFWKQAALEMKNDGMSDRLSQLTNYGVHRAAFELPNDLY